MDNFREYVAQMREAAPRSDDMLQVSKELWLQIADVIEELWNEIEDLGGRNVPECPRLAVPCYPGTYVRFKGCEVAWKVVCINFYAEGIPTASVTNGKITNTMPLTDLTEAEILCGSSEQ